MDAITGSISANPIISVVSIAFIIVLILYFTFKSLSKLVMILFFIFLVILGYNYFKDPDKVREYCKSMVSGITELSEKRKTFLQDSKEVFKETKGASGEVNKLLDTSDKEMKKEFKK